MVSFTHEIPILDESVVFEPEWNFRLECVDKKAIHDRKDAEIGAKADIGMIAGMIAEGTAKSIQSSR